MVRTARRGPVALSPSDLTELDTLYSDVETYYSNKIVRHGAIPLGVDWSCEATQRLRFVQLLKLCDFAHTVSVNDVGCGYGALAVFMAERYPSAEIDYWGFDLSRAMIERARRRHRGKPNVRFSVAQSAPRIADFAVASGVMNVKLEQALPLWERFVQVTLLDMHRTSRIGFAVNFLAAPTPGAPEGQLYCPAPERWAGFCREALGCSVTIVRDYGLREYTLLARHLAA